LNVSLLNKEIYTVSSYHPDILGLIGRQNAAAASFSAAADFANPTQTRAFANHELTLDHCR
jgi:hypothetical protein